MALGRILGAGTPVLLMILAASRFAAAEAVPQPRDFTFKMVKVSDIQAAKRITVQIDPIEQAALLAAAPKIDPHPTHHEDGAVPAPLTPVAPAGAHYGWFWDKVPVALDAADGRFPLALAALSEGPDGSRVDGPRLQAMQGLAQTWGTEILQDTVGTKVSPALVLAVISVESGGDVAASSGAGKTDVLVAALRLLALSWGTLGGFPNNVKFSSTHLAQM